MSLTLCARSLWIQTLGAACGSVSRIQDKKKSISTSFARVLAQPADGWLYGACDASHRGAGGDEQRAVRHRDLLRLRSCARSVRELRPKTSHDTERRTQEAWVRSPRRHVSVSDPSIPWLTTPVPKKARKVGTLLCEIRRVGRGRTQHALGKGGDQQKRVKRVAHTWYSFIVDVATSTS